MSRRIKVLHVIHSLYGGGAETQLRILCKAGVEYGIESTIFCVDSGKDGLVDNRNVITYQRKSKLDIGIYGAIKSAIAEVDADIVHAWLPPVVTVPALIAAKKAGVPVIISYRNVQKIRGLKDFVEFVVSLYASCGVASNTPIELCSFPFRWLYNKKQSVVISNAVSIPNQEKYQKQIISNDDKLKILFVGRITEQKNWKCLMQAVGMIKEDISWCLTICGKGSEEDQLLKKIESNFLAEKVKFIGYSDNVHKIMSEHDVLVLPSWYEGVPNVLLEAFAIGLPALVSDIPSHRSVIGNKEVALIFPPDSPDILCSKLEQLTRAVDLRTKLVANARELIKGHSPEIMAKAYSAYYQKLMCR